jgi:hypothetical protein
VCCCCRLQILGDRSLKYKYINPNLLFVATATGSGSSTPADESPSAAAAGGAVKHDQQVSVALINTVSGAVLHQQLHEGASGPVHAAVSEHWVAYAFRDLATMRQQVRGVAGEGRVTGVGKAEGRAMSVCSRLCRLVRRQGGEKGVG